MASLHSPLEMAEFWGRLRGLAQKSANIFLEAHKYEAWLETTFRTPSAIEADMQVKYDAAADVKTLFNTLLDAVSTTYPPVVKVGMGSDFEAFVIDVDNDGASGHVSVDQGSGAAETPLDVFDANDIVGISKAEQSANNGRLKVSALVGGGTGLTFTEDMTGTDNTEDTKLELRLKER